MQSFQYPRADRLIVGVTPRRNSSDWPWCFSILVRIDLLLGVAAYNEALDAILSFSILVRIDLLLGLGRAVRTQTAPRFQYPRADRLIVGVGIFSTQPPWLEVSVSSCGSTYCWGLFGW